MDNFDTRKDENYIQVDRSLLEALDAFTSAVTWMQAKRVVQAHPELLTDETDTLLSALISQQEDRRVIRILQDHRQILARCRAEGIEAAFAEHVESEPSASDSPPNPYTRARSADSYDAMVRLVNQHPELVPAIKRQLAEVIGQQEMAVVEAIEAFLAAESWREAKRIVNARPALLSLEADIWLSQYVAFVESQGDADIAKILLERRWLLARCRLEGVDAAFQGRMLDGL